MPGGLKERSTVPVTGLFSIIPSKASLFKRRVWSREVLYINNPLDVNNIAGQIQRNSFISPLSEMKGLGLPCFCKVFPGAGSPVLRGLPA